MKKDKVFKSVDVEDQKIHTCLESKSLGRLKQILGQDYGVILSDTEAEQFGYSLLKVTRLAIGVFNRTEGNHLMTT